MPPSPKLTADPQLSNPPCINFIAGIAHKERQKGRTNSNSQMQEQTRTMTYRLQSFLKIWGVCRQMKQ